MTSPRLSICIPTYNRENLLRETLGHLRDVCDDSVEIAISDNASPDGTQEVIKSFASQFRYFRAIRQTENRGPAHNAWAVVLQARGRYLYPLSDDDQIHFQALQNAMSIMERDPHILAVFGGYEEWERSTGATTSYRLVESRTDFARGDKLGIFNRFSLLWNPVWRTDYFQRYCWYDGRSFGMWDLIGSLLEHGSVSAIPDLFYKHAHTMPRLEYELTEGWYHDAHRAQYETFIGRMGPVDPMKLAPFVSERVTPAYVHGASFAEIKGDFLTARHFILRGRAYGLVAERDVVLWERNSLVAMLAERLRARLKLYPEIDQIVFDAAPRLQQLRARVQAIAPDYSVISVADTKFPQEGLQPNQFLVTYHLGFLDSGTAAQREPALCVAVEDLIETCRMTDQPLTLDATGAAEAAPQ